MQDVISTKGPVSFWTGKPWAKDFPRQRFLQTKNPQGKVSDRDTSIWDSLVVRWRVQRWVNLRRIPNLHRNSHASVPNQTQQRVGTADYQLHCKAWGISEQEKKLILVRQGGFSAHFPLFSFLWKQLWFNFVNQPDESVSRAVARNFSCMHLTRHLRATAFWLSECLVNTQPYWVQMLSFLSLYANTTCMHFTFRSANGCTSVLILSISFRHGSHTPQKWFLWNHTTISRDLWSGKSCVIAQVSPFVVWEHISTRMRAYTQNRFHGR